MVFFIAPIPLPLFRIGRGFDFFPNGYVEIRRPSNRRPMFPGDYVRGFQRQPDGNRRPSARRAETRPRAPSVRFSSINTMKTNAIMYPSTVQLVSSKKHQYTLTFKMHCSQKSTCEIIPRRKLKVRYGTIQFEEASLPIEVNGDASCTVQPGIHECSFDLKIPRNTSLASQLFYRKGKLLHLVVTISPPGSPGDILFVHIVIPYANLRSSNSPISGIKIRQVVHNHTGVFEIENLYGAKPDEQTGAHRECAICFSETRSAVMLPCKHLCCCVDCAKTLHNNSIKESSEMVCPICRQSVSHIGFRE
uniref:RING-type domain-containing protein n=1 Tax=Paramoeba aestuarina TaxID=180227 RepID=A0A7S4KTF1_9EUKA|mmetsp:Transcript_25175/g.39262  ORF Transcript_25175/g.39262 Transcript_25175/m.39262 type:complete len:305 (+) Transcript_25175:23-937(+)